MKINKAIVLLLLTLSSILQSNEPLIQKKKVSIGIALPLLKSIDHYSITVGTGPTQMYAFIDPVCPRSRDFVEMILENTKMQKLYTYHFFFYELERFRTKALIADIYNSTNAIEKMKKIMVKKEEVQGLKVIPDEIQKEMDAISNIAKKLDIYKRPYLFVVKPIKGAK
jgi:hypothetical protein